jgi:hypothetical protein
MGRVKTTFTNAVQRNKQSERDTNVIQKVTHPLSSFCVGQKKKKSFSTAGGVAQVVEPSKHEALSSNFRTTKKERKKERKSFSKCFQERKVIGKMLPGKK